MSRPEVDDYRRGGFDDRAYNGLARKLRALPENERLEFVEEMLLHNSVLGLRLAKSCLRERTSLERLLARGISTADASEIRWWLAALVPKLGFRRVLDFVRERVETEPHAVGRVLYWLADHVPEGRQDMASEFSALVTVAEAKGLIRRSRASPDPHRPGRILFEPLDD